MKLEFILLGVLAFRSYSGYDLTKWFDREGQFLRSNVHHSQIYRALGKMVANGLVEYTVHSSEGRPDAKVYRITETGRALLVEVARSPYQPPSRFQDPEFVSRLWFLTIVAPDEIVDLIDTELAFRTAQVAASRGRSLSIDSADAVPDDVRARAHDIHLRIHEHGKNAVDAWIQWLETTRAELQQNNKQEGN
ncbi:PadR family transcriptional regulator [Microbacterium sp. YY-01]|uniref:PadR family transcriptional regulator n=1 Tax=Microbacterium sp. YY-01 TaxID=3421634 RepID=UPI003D167401